MSQHKRNLIVALFIVVGCSSIDKVELSKNNLNDAIAEVQKLRDNLVPAQFNLLAKTHFNSGEHYFAKAKDGLKSNNEESDILDKLSQAKAY